ncbi:hypothetical protein HBH56_020780 [Parastagonospora nodorum]|uniref:Uncharacterized protein n=2 Tax=Phaeosphaeria nodorum (strain SN15 / ATCC MYA-4574 / FGSC 10173) TaxID=321614 RepID=A0A7U2EYZ7_PHANO|nr:hypothetical protein SNOG_03135 [Parastagonospora nodorum SN15]KAH3919945.1 hypothetical protein HBH56_020780 [Parastagonospora nodorum]EAT89866.1 hypothetical protein SNOG_03135 [Parastagonospora nodorum SN15]KAH3937226.1 hypothetical protein HBH54_013720 [Parastagonospora nodorum]KAH3967706.1 hypothetical protein HBH51_137450 [Parastagonospora nodorum]KAH4059160.1 hypothetical protein HBH49_014680 [Parastagonospora nodorum]
MSDTEASKSKASVGWTDRQRLAYFFSLVDFSKVKLDYANAPRPEGKSVGACQIMVHRLKGTLKDDLEALRTGTAMPEEAPKKAAGTPKSTPRKRKAKGDADGEGEATPTKKGRKKKTALAEEEPAAADEDETELKVKAENVDEEFSVGDD